MVNIDRVFKDEKFPGVLVVQDMFGQQYRYIMKEGVLHPVNVMTCYWEGFTVKMAIPLPVGLPEILSIEGKG